MKKIKFYIAIIVIVSLIFIFPATVKATNNEELGENVSKVTELGYNTWTEAYKSIIEASQKDNSAIQYALVDINDDGVLELIVIEGNSEKEKKVYFYTYMMEESNYYAIIYLGNISSNDISIYSVENNCILGVCRNNGEQTIYKIEIEKYTEENTYGDNADMYRIKTTQIDENDMTIHENNLIEFYNCNDYSIINFYSIQTVNHEIGENVFKVTELAYNTWQEAYKSIIEASQKDNSATQYALVDINNDGVLELIVIEGSTEAEKKIYFYTYIKVTSNDYGIIYLGNISGSHLSLYNSTDNYILGAYRNDEKQMAYKIVLNKYTELDNKGNEIDGYVMVVISTNYENKDINENNAIKFYNYDDFSLTEWNIENKEYPENSTEDNTVAKKVLPHTGDSIKKLCIIASALILIIISCIVITYKKHISDI